jgi:hypothetical protein
MDRDREEKYQGEIMTDCFIADTVRLSDVSYRSLEGYAKARSHRIGIFCAGLLLCESKDSPSLPSS